LATETHRNRQFIRIQSASSTDLINWQLSPKDALVRPAVWSTTLKTWAPDVPYKENGRFYLPLSIEDSDQTMAITIAKSDEPDGEYVDDSKEPLVTGPVPSRYTHAGYFPYPVPEGTHVNEQFNFWDLGAHIDPHIRRRDDGRVYLIWGSDFQPIQEIELKDDLSGVAPGARPRALMYPNPMLDNERLIEGYWEDPDNDDPAWEDVYYSGADCFGRGRMIEVGGQQLWMGEYSVNFARRNRRTGVVQRRTDVDPNARDNIILEGSLKIQNPGNNSTVRLGRRKIGVAHAVDRNDPYMGDHHPDKPMLNKRKMIIFEILKDENGWAYVPGGRFNPTQSGALELPR
jgi:hypothetical protein